MTQPDPPTKKFFGMRMPSMKEGSFARNQSYVLARNVVAIAAQLVFTPIITRLYAPEAYGTMNAVISLSALALPFFTLQYDRAMLMARDEKDIHGLRAISNLLPTLFSVLLFLLLLIGGDPLLIAVGLPALGKMALLIPGLVILTALAQTSQQMVAVRMRYKQSFQFGTISIVGTKLTAIIHGVFIGGGAFGLVLAEIFSRGSQLIFSSRFILHERFHWHPKSWDPSNVKAVMRKYINFPKFELPAVGIAQFANQVPLWWLPSTYGLAVFGQYGLSLSLLEMPMRLFSYSMSVTFYQKAAQVFQDRGAKALRSITFRTMAFISLGSLVPLLLIAFFAEDLFTFFFGPEWGLAGRMAQVLSIIYFTRLTVEPVSSVLRVIGKQHSYVWFHGLLFVLRASAAGASIYFALPIMQAIALYAVADSIGRLFLTAQIIASLNRLAAMDRTE